MKKNLLSTICMFLCATSIIRIIDDSLSYRKNARYAEDIVNSRNAASSINTDNSNSIKEVKALDSSVSKSILDQNMSGVVGTHSQFQVPIENNSTEQLTIDEAQILGIELAESGDYKNSKQALRLLESVLQIRSLDSVVISLMVDQYEKLGKTNDAINLFRQLILVRPSDADLAAGLARLLILQERLVEAIPYLEIASQSADPIDFEWLDLAQAYERVGDYTRSQEAYERAINESSADDLWGQYVRSVYMR